MKFDFSKIAPKYTERSLVQQSAAMNLINLVELKSNEDVLDVGCGAGNITRKIRKLTNGKVVGIDTSEGMIDRARIDNVGKNIVFDVVSAENMDYNDSFDVIFCNSAFQWFKEPEKVLLNCHRALRSGGRMAIQAPAKEEYSPNFIKAIERVKKDPRISKVFSKFKPPWFFMETAGQYAKLFENSGFTVVFSKIVTEITEYSPDKVFDIFMSGAAAGYLNQDFYDVELTEDFVDNFKDVVGKSFHEQAFNGKLELHFNRIYLLAVAVK